MARAHCLLEKASMELILTSHIEVATKVHDTAEKKWDLSSLRSIETSLVKNKFKLL